MGGVGQKRQNSRYSAVFVIKYCVIQRGIGYIKTRSGDKGYKIAFIHNLNKIHSNRCEHKELFPVKSYFLDCKYKFYYILGVGKLRPLTGECKLGKLRPSTGECKWRL